MPIPGQKAFILTYPYANKNPTKTPKNPTKTFNKNLTKIFDKNPTKTPQKFGGTKTFWGIARAMADQWTKNLL